MRKTLLIALPAMLLAAGCNDSDTSAPPRKIEVRSQAQQELHQLDRLNLAIALKRAIYASGNRCQRIEDAGYVQEHGNLSMWTASCNDGKSWAIFAGPDGSAQVRPCQDLAELGLPACTISKRPAE